MPSPPNTFAARRPRPELCFGRGDLCREITTSAFERGSSLLFGGRQCGKTTVLLKIASELAKIRSKTNILSSHDIPVYVNLMLLPFDVGPGEVLRFLSTSTLQACCQLIDGYTIADLPSNAFGASIDITRLASDLDAIAAAAGEVTVRFLFLIDEAKRILGNRFSRGFQDNLFALLYGETPIAGRCAMVFAGAQELYQFCEDDTSPIASRASFHFLDNLRLPDICAIVALLHPDTPSLADQDYGEFIYTLTGGQASLSVWLASNLTRLDNFRGQGAQLIEELLREHHGLLQGWIHKLSPEARLVQQSLLLTNSLKLSHIPQLLNNSGLDVFQARRAAQELVFTGIVTRSQDMIALSNAIYTAFAKSYLVNDEPNPDSEASVWALIENTELSLRRLIRYSYNKKWGTSADKKMEQVLGQEEWKSIISHQEHSLDAYRFSPQEPGDILDYTYLGQLGKMIMWSGSWDLFRHLFKDKRELTEMLAEITPVRNDKAHFRPVPSRELDRCRIRCDDLLQLVEKGLQSLL